MHINVSAGAEVAIVGATIAGCGSQRQYAVTEAEIRLNLDTTRDLHLALHPDVAQYRYDSGRIEMVFDEEQFVAGRSVGRLEELFVVTS